MRRYDVGITEGQICPVVAGGPRPRSVDLVGVEARDEQAAIAVAEDLWRTRHGDEPPSALIGISRAY